MYTDGTAIKDEQSYLDEVDNFVEDLLLAISFRNSQVGRTYLQDCLVMACLESKPMLNLSEDIYPVIAERYNTTIAGVSKAIRHCLISCFNDGNLKRINRIFRCDIVGSVPPTNAEFIITMAIFIKRYLRSKSKDIGRVTFLNI